MIQINEHHIRRCIKIESRGNSRNATSAGTCRASSRGKRRKIHEKENVLLRETHVCRWPYARQLHNNGKNMRPYRRRRSSIGTEESARQASAPESQCSRGRRSNIFCV